MRKELMSIYILEILSRHASKEYTIYQKDIMERLQIDYEIEVSRKTLGKYLSYLRSNGYIEGERGVYKVNDFSDKELRILIDSVLYSQHIPGSEAKRIIKKLKNISHKGLKKKMLNINYLESLNRTQNDNLYNVLDAIDQAIEENKKIRITSCQYNIEGQLQDTWKQEIDPYYIVASNSRYYLICYSKRKDKAGKAMLESRRIDRISNVEILEDEKREPLTNITGSRSGFDLGRYMREHVYMFSGESDYITIRMKEEHIGIFIDWYGFTDEYGRSLGVTKVEGDKGYIQIKVKSNLNATYYWALQYGELVEIIKPTSLRNRIVGGLKNILAKYEEANNE